jgi:tetratricopeptide (TPR) repeat protein
LKEYPENDKVKYFLAIALAEQKNYKKADETLKTISAQSDYYSQALILESFILEKEKKYLEAIEILQKALVIAPKKIDIYLNLAALYEQTNNLSAGKKVLLEGLEIDPDQAELYFRLGVLADKTGHKRETIQQMKTAIKKDPFHVMALNYLGYTYAERGTHLDEAEELIKRALKFRPNDGYIIDSLGWVYYKKKKFDEALVELEKAWKLAPNDPAIGEHLGEVYFKKGLWDKALKIYRRVLEAHPTAKEKENILKRIKEAQQKLDDEKGVLENPTTLY